MAWIITQGQSIFPLKISENKRYFVTRQENPFLYHADTGWGIFTKLTTEEAVEYLSFRKSQGFNTIQAIIAYNPADVNRYGQKAFDGNVDFSQPNEAYHDHIIKIIQKADSLGLLIVMAQPWVGCCGDGFGITPGNAIQRNGVEKNRMYGEYLGKKFAGLQNLFWIIGGDNDPKADRECLVAFAESIYSSAPKHQLMTYHASPAHSSTDLFQYAPWLGFSMIYTYWREKPNPPIVADLMPHVYEEALREWSKTDIMPFVLGESQYEGSGKRGNDMGNPQSVRRQAWWTILCGGAGHAYGSDLYFFPSDWRDIMRYPGAYQMGYLKQFFDQIPWWTLVPDVRHQAVVSGYGDWSKSNYVTTAVSKDKKLMVTYIPEIRPVYVDFGFLSGNSFKCTWFNPVTGKKGKEFLIDKKTVQRMCPVYGEDWILMIQSE
ncbi:MAG: hypothetical protein A2W90_10695 [Bacteroidetes bacterium GWF2_42_66]|nr:MAG: hypothetical protein A2W92_09685 [Bacteroidetes bacterium GWA2_42_15]OFY01952.1 MAG: hypothetical protein A2W89_23875 [Bacteroidetes bacterium GWE2_42_39]OFY44752.1 MAG: hypothetical protein A2W90_10695 [Bacteroidetes bacterium GWF2_42_66]